MEGKHELGLSRPKLFLLTERISSLFKEYLEFQVQSAMQYEH